MSEYENTVASGEELEGMLADDAQATDTDVVSIEELTENLLEDDGGETAEHAGDGDPAGEATEQKTAQKKDDKAARQLRAALKSQRAQIFKDLGMDESEVRELILEAKAAKMHKEDPEISPKAARRIVEAQEKAKTGGNPAIVAGIQSLIDDGWTHEELEAFTTDEQVRHAINNEGKSVHQAATAYLRRGAVAKPATARKSAVPTARHTAAGSVPAKNRIKEMSDAEFEALDRKVMAAAFAGKRVRLDT